MEPTESDDHHHRPPPPMPPSQLMQSLLPRDSRGSLEVFNPSGYSSSSSSSSFRSTHPNLKTPQFLPDPPRAADKVATWMALKKTSDPAEVSAASQRAAEWGLVLKTDAGTGKPQGVIARTSGDDEPGKAAAARVRPSGGSLRSSGESSDDCGAAGGRDRGVPRVSEDLKDALSAFQQTFVVSDGTRSDYPILYASEGFFKMTGYTSKEVIGRNCRFLQGPDTDPEDAAKIREALHAGTSYCGRLLNYKKDGTPFWNLLTIAPIKDDNGNVIKFIGMQVEVSKHTEGSKDKMVRPNGLPQSFIRYDARQKEDATSSVSELMMAFKRPRALSESYNRGRPLTKSDGGGAPERLETSRRRNSEATAAPPRRKSRSGTTAATMQPIHELPQKKQKKSDRRSFNPLSKKSSEAQPKTDFETSDSGAILDGDGDGDGEGDGDDCGDDDVASDNEWLESVEDGVRKKDMRKGLDLATTLERIEKNFVITDPRLPDNPIIFASDSFLELTEYSREEILGTNCRFLQGPETDRATVRKIREAVDNETDVTVQLINYTKTGKKFWNIFHLQPMRDQKGKVQYFIGVQLDGTQHIEPHHSSVPEATANESAKLVKQTAENVDEAVRELPDANTKPEDLWTNHSKMVLPKPHKRDSPSWKAIQKILDGGEQIGLKHFRPVRPLGSGDTGSVHLVELYGTGEYFAMKAMDKNIMLNRNKVHRACAEREILDMLDHPFLPALYASFQTKTHICLITDFYPGGELFVLLDRQPKKVLREDAVKFYAAEVVIALEYLHCQGIIYRDLKPENILLQRSGHVSLTDFDLSCLTSCKPQLLIMKENQKKKSKKGRQPPLFLAEPMRASNSFVGTEEYIAPEIVKGAGHTSAVDWWALGILIYEMLYGYTPFRGKTRQRTFANILHKDLKFPGSIPVSLQAKQLMFGLLHKDPKQRLGSREGANEIKQHQFFRGVSWALVRCMDPPQLDGPLVMTTEATPEVEVDPELIDLQANVF